MGRILDKNGLNLRMAVVNGGAAGNLTVTGISTDDIIERIFAAAFTINAATPADNSPIDLTASAGDLTSQFSITAANTINNAGGTSTASNVVFVLYWDADD